MPTDHDKPDNKSQEEKANQEAMKQARADDPFAADELSTILSSDTDSPADKLNKFLIANGIAAEKIEAIMAEDSARQDNAFMELKISREFEADADTADTFAALEETLKDADIAFSVKNFNSEFGGSSCIHIKDDDKLTAAVEALDFQKVQSNLRTIKEEKVNAEAEAKRRAEEAQAKAATEAQAAAKTEKENLLKDNPKTKEKLESICGAVNKFLEGNGINSDKISANIGVKDKKLCIEVKASENLPDGANAVFKELQTRLKDNILEDHFLQGNFDSESGFPYIGIKYHDQLEEDVEKATKQETKNTEKDQNQQDEEEAEAQRKAEEEQRKKEEERRAREKKQAEDKAAADELARNTGSDEEKAAAEEKIKKDNEEKIQKDFAEVKKRVEAANESAKRVPAAEKKSAEFVDKDREAKATADKAISGAQRTYRNLNSYTMMATIRLISDETEKAASLTQDIENLKAAERELRTAVTASDAAIKAKEAAKAAVDEEYSIKHDVWRLRDEAAREADAVSWDAGLLKVENIDLNSSSYQIAQACEQANADRSRSQNTKEKYPTAIEEERERFQEMQEKLSKVETLRKEAEKELAALSEHVRLAAEEALRKQAEEEKEREEEAAAAAARAAASANKDDEDEEEELDAGDLGITAPPIKRNLWDRLTGVKKKSDDQSKSYGAPGATFFMGAAPTASADKKDKKSLAKGAKNNKFSINEIANFFTDAIKAHNEEYDYESGYTVSKSTFKKSFTVNDKDGHEIALVDKDENKAIRYTFSQEVKFELADMVLRAAAASKDQELTLHSSKLTDIEAILKAAATPPNNDKVKIKLDEATQKFLADKDPSELVGYPFISSRMGIDSAGHAIQAKEETAEKERQAFEKVEAAAKPVIDAYEVAKRDLAKAEAALSASIGDGTAEKQAKEKAEREAAAAETKAREEAAKIKTAKQVYDTAKAAVSDVKDRMRKGVEEAAKQAAEEFKQEVQAKKAAAASRKLT